MAAIKRKRKTKLPKIYLKLLLCLILSIAFAVPLLFGLSSSFSSWQEECPMYGCLIHPEEFTSRIRLSLTQQQCTLLTYPSNQEHVNQDRAVFIESFVTHQPTQFLLGIFDGHGKLGHEVAEYVMHEFPRLLASKLNARQCCGDDAWIRQVLNETFVQVDRELPESAYQGGCTATVVLRVGNQLYFANVGDSRTILVQGDEIVYETRRDKPHLPEERARIEGLGGKVHIPEKNPNLSRVIAFAEHAEPPETIGLAMSRSLGDWDFHGVIAEPLIDVRKVPTNSFLLAASDGVWDLRPKEGLAKRFAKGRGDVGKALRIAFGEISPKSGYRDDMTAALVRLD